MYLSVLEDSDAAVGGTEIDTDADVLVLDSFFRHIYDESIKRVTRNSYFQFWINSTLLD